MQNVELDAEFRASNGKGFARRLRMAGQIPAVLYSHGKATSISLTLAHVQKAFHSHAGSHAIFRLKLSGTSDGKASAMALIRDVQRDPLTGRVMHLDFFELSEKDMVRNRVPVEIVGEVPVGVKLGGVLEHHVREVTVECLPAAMPDHIKLDASTLGLNESFHVSDLAALPGLRILDSPDTVLVHVLPPRTEAPAETVEVTPVEAPKK
ncbi:MAG: 50S ribosomal protein L25 [Nitrospirae bacterium]|jgi:large subunit ribosomal protein L25|nr:50S ribosomal protein L25 [Nitrospirota bacterium]